MPQNILGTYTAIGIVEYWDTSMHLFNARVKSSVVNWSSTQVHNRGQTSSVRQETLQWARSSPEIEK